MSRPSPSPPAQPRRCRPHGQHTVRTPRRATAGCAATDPPLDTDVDAIGRILAQATAYWKGLDPEVFVEVDPEQLADRYRAGKQFPSDLPVEDRCTLVATLGDTVVGFADVTISRPGTDVDIHRPDIRGWVLEIAVAEHLRGHGIGRHLLTAAEAWARDRGAKHILLDTHPANVEALHFYQARMAYAPVGVRLTKRLTTE